MTQPSDGGGGGAVPVDSSEETNTTESLRHRGFLADIDTDERRFLEVIFGHEEPEPIRVAAHDVPDFALFLAGERPAASIATFAKMTDDLREPADLVERDPVSDAIDALGIPHYTSGRQKKDVLYLSHYVAADAERIDGYLECNDIHHIRAKGEFLGYPEPAIKENLTLNLHGTQWNEFLRTEIDPSDERLADLAALPYVPATTVEGYRRGVRRGSRYRNSLEEIASLYPCIEADVRMRVEGTQTLKEE